MAKVQKTTTEAEESAVAWDEENDPASVLEVEEEKLPDIKLALEFRGFNYRLRTVNTKSIAVLSTRIAEEEYRRTFPGSKATLKQILKYIRTGDNDTLMMAVGLNIAWEGTRGAPVMSEVFEYEELTSDDRNEILAGVYFFEQKNRRNT